MRDHKALLILGSRPASLTVLASLGSRRVRCAVSWISTLSWL